MSASGVSVVVPCRDAAAWIGELLDSLAAQTLRPERVVVVDDGSSDGSAEAVRRWSADHAGALDVRLLTSRGQGLAAAVKTGMEHVESPFVARIDADDLLHPQYLQRLHHALQQHPEAAYAYSAMRMFGSASGRYHTAQFDPARLVVEGNFVCAGALMRREAYERSGGLAELPAWEDWDLWLRFLDGGDVGVLVDEELYFWRRHEHSRNTLTWGQRRRLRLRIWWRHRRLVARYALAGLPHALRRARRPLRQQ